MFTFRHGTSIHQPKSIETMQKLILYLFFAILAGSLSAQETKSISLSQPDTNRGLPVMKALSLRASATDYDTTALKLQDLSDLVWAAEDAGIVSQNIALFCAGVGLSTRPRGTINQQKLAEELKLKPSQHLMLNHPVSYPMR
jgi:hypothetical protein